MFVSAFFFCLMTIFVKIAAEEFETIQIFFMRGIITLLITYYILKRKKIYVWGKNQKILIARGVVGSFALLLVYESLNRLTLAQATVIQYLYPIFIAILASFLLKETLNKNIILSAILGLIGVFWILNFPFMNSEIVFDIGSIGIAVTGSILTALAYVLVRLASTYNESPYVIMFYFPLFTVIMAVPFIYQSWSKPTLYYWMVLVIIGVCTQLGQWFLTFGYKLLPASKVAPISYAQVPFAVISGFLFFGEGIYLNFIVGSIIIFIGIYILINKKQKLTFRDV
mgnify:CR=1 FL=1